VKREVREKEMGEAVLSRTHGDEANVHTCGASSRLAYIETVGDCGGQSTLVIGNAPPLGRRFLLVVRHYFRRAMS
jgi:hypothetical protein